MQHYIYSIHVDDIVFPKFPTTYTEILHVFHELIRGLDNTRLQYHVNYLGISGTLRLQFREGRKIYLKGCFPYNYIHYILSNIMLCSIFFFMQIFNFQGKGNVPTHRFGCSHGYNQLQNCWNKGLWKGFPPRPLPPPLKTMLFNCEMSMLSQTFNISSIQSNIECMGGWGGGGRGGWQS